MRTPEVQYNHKESNIRLFMNMLILIGVLITLTTALVIRKVHLSGRADAAYLGEVSEQWLAEHRASHPL